MINIILAGIIAISAVITLILNFVKRQSKKPRIRVKVNFSKTSNKNIIKINIINVGGTEIIINHIQIQPSNKAMRKKEDKMIFATNFQSSIRNINFPFILGAQGRNLLIEMEIPDFTIKLFIENKIHFRLIFETTSQKVYKSNDINPSNFFTK